jgi:endonuclease/exonuclease/phosphatase (EEP) superfamily protein YafD
VWPQPAADADAPSLRVLTVNVRASNAQYDAIVALIEDKDPDLLLIVELTNGLEAALRPLTARYPYQITSERRDVFGIGLYSKTALDSAEIHPLRASTFPLIQAQTTVSGQPITIFGAHPVPPFGGHGTRMRDADIAELGELVNAVDGPIIVMGDLNASVWSRPLRQLLATTRLQDGGRGFGMQPTWPSGSVLFGIPIDHVLVSAEFDVLTRTVGPAIGSDHQPVTADLRLIAP